MRCPYCRTEIRVSGRFCPHCGRQIFGLPVPPTASPAAGAFQPPAPPPGPPRPPTAAAQPQVRLATSEVIGKTCPFDQFPISQSDTVILCPECGVPHHADCWRENGGCTTYGCARSPSSAPAVQAGSGPAHTYGYQNPVRPSRRTRLDPMEPALALMATEVERHAGNALLWAIIGLFCCPILSIIGFFMALAVFATLARTGIESASARTKAAFAIVVGTLACGVWATILLALVQGGQGPSY